MFHTIKVTGAKVVTSAKNPGSKCYGLVTLATVEEAENCIKQLNKTEFNGRIISLEKVSFCSCTHKLSWLDSKCSTFKHNKKNTVAL